MAAQRYAALLRGINVGGHNRMPMAELRDLASELGWSEVQTYIQSGNLVFASAGKASALEAQLEKAITARWGYSVPVLVRSRTAFGKHLRSNPFPEASAVEPNKVLLAECKKSPRKAAVQELEDRAGNGERVALRGTVLWVHCPSGLGNTKLSQAFVDRAVGSTVTMRNWRTALKLGELLGL